MSRVSLIGRPRPSSSRPSARSESRCPVEEPAHPTPVVGITTYLLRGLEERVAAFVIMAAGSGVKLAATLKVTALGIGADKAALLVDQFGAAHRTELPPVILIDLGWLGHVFIRQKAS